MATGIFGVAATLAKMKAFDALVGGAVNAAHAEVMLGSQAIVRRHASGRPGPNVIDDDFRSGITGLVVSGYPRFLGVIYSDAAQALRLEFGYRGTDSLGRSYDQPPYPSFGPALPEISELAERLYPARISAVLK